MSTQARRGADYTRVHSDPRAEAVAWFFLAHQLTLLALMAAAHALARLA